MFKLLLNGNFVKKNPTMVLAIFSTHYLTDSFSKQVFIIKELKYSTLWLIGLMARNTRHEIVGSNPEQDQKKNRFCKTRLSRISFLLKLLSPKGPS